MNPILVPRRERGDATPVQDSLFGDPEPLPTPAAATSGCNDLDLVESVIRAAQDPGYVLLDGRGERVMLRDPAGLKGSVEPVPVFEQAVVRQLLDGGLLTLGSPQRVRYADRNGPARSVLVPRSTRATAARWAHLHPPRGARPSRTTAGPRGRA